MVMCVLYSKRIILTAVTNGALSIYRKLPMMGMLASRLLPPLPELLLLLLERPGIARPCPEKSPPMMGMLARKLPLPLPLEEAVLPLLVLGLSRLLVLPPLLLAALLLPPRTH